MDTSLLGTGGLWAHERCDKASLARSVFESEMEVIILQDRQGSGSFRHTDSSPGDSADGVGHFRQSFPSSSDVNLGITLL